MQPENAASVRDREWVEWGFANLTLPEALRRLRAVNADRAARDEEPLGEPPFTGKRDRLDDDPPGDIEGGSAAQIRDDSTPPRGLGMYGDSLIELLFEHFNADVTKLVWLDEGRWLLADCEEPGLYVIEMYPAKAVRDVL